MNNFFINVKNNWLSFVLLFALFLLWEFLGTNKIINPLFISNPTKIFSQGMEMIATGEIYPHFFISMKALFLGFIAAILVGIPSGIIIGSNKTLFKVFTPYVFALNSLPTVAIIPLIIIWLGIGISAKIAIVFLMALKSILINTIDGVRNVDAKYVKMARSFNASPPFILKTVIIFSVLPYIFSGLKIATGRVITGLVVSEAFGYGKGLGFLVSFYGNTYQTPRLMFVILLLLATSISLTGFIGIMEKRIIKWNQNVLR